MPTAYYNYTITSTGDTSASTDYSIGYDWEPKMTKEPKKQEKQYEVKSEIMTWYSKQLGLTHGNYNLLLHNSLLNADNSKLVNDFAGLQKVYGAAYQSIAIDMVNPDISLITDKLLSKSFFKNIFVEGVLELLHGNMRKALAIKSMIGKLNGGTKSYLFLRTMTQDSIDDMAKRLNLIPDEDGYKVTVDGKEQHIALEGIEANESVALVRYARIQSISLDNITLFENFKDNCILIHNGE